jgi:hypothetical protein
VYVARVGEKGDAFRFLFGKPNYRKEDNIKMEPKEIGWEHVDLMEMRYDRYRWQTVVNSVMNFRVP